MMTLRLFIVILLFGSNVPIERLFLSDDSSLQSASTTTTFKAAFVTSTTTFPAALRAGSAATLPAAFGIRKAAKFQATLETTTTERFPAALGNSTTSTLPDALGNRTSNKFPVALGTNISTTFPSALAADTTTTFPDALWTNQTFSLNVSDPDYTIQSFCQHLDCPLSEANKSPVTNPCCIPCDCDDSCFRRGTCCKLKLDSFHTPSSKIAESNGIVEQCFEAQIRGLSADYWPTEPKSYLLIHTCPTNTTSSRATINKCLRPKTFVLDQQVPVYSGVTHRNYRNVYCAECNDDANNIMLWDSKLKCKDTGFESVMLSNDVNQADFDIKTIILSLMRVNCVIEWIPVSEIVPSDCINQELIKSSCRSELFTSDVDLICRTGQYAPVRTKIGVYRNVFCLACNEGDSVLENKCSANVADRKPFSALISLAPYISNYKAAMPKIADICADGFVVDELLGYCIMKTCPISEVRVRKTCMPVITQVSDVCFDYKLQLKYPKEELRKEGHDSVVRQILALVLTQSTDELVDHKAAIIDIETDNVVISIQVTKFVTTPTTIGEAFQNVTHYIETYNTRNYSARSRPSVQLVSAAFNNLSDSYVNYATYKDSPAYLQCSVPPIAMASIQTCETVFIHDYILLDDDSFETNNLTFFPGEYIARMGQFNQYEYISGFSLCYSTYLSKALELKSTTTTTATKRTTTLPTLIIIEEQSEPMVGQSKGPRLRCAGLAFMFCALIHMMIK